MYKAQSDEISETENGVTRSSFILTQNIIHKWTQCCYGHIPNADDSL